MHVRNLLNYCFSLLNMEICDFLVMVGEMVQNVYIHSHLMVLLLTNIFIHIQQLMANNFIQHGHRACELCHLLDLDLQTLSRTLQRAVWKFP